MTEMSGNHSQSLDRALAIVDAAADAGVDAIKLDLQRRYDDTLPQSGRVFHQRSQLTLDGQSMHALYSRLTLLEWHALLWSVPSEKFFPLAHHLMSLLLISRFT